MDTRIEEITRNGSELAADYVGDVLQAARRFTDTLLDNVATLTRGVIKEGRGVVLAACDVFLPD